MDELRYKEKSLKGLEGESIEMYCLIKGLRRKRARRTLVDLPCSGISVRVELLMEGRADDPRVRRSSSICCVRESSYLDPPTNGHMT